MAKTRSVVLTGPPKIGKTTVVERLIDLLQTEGIEARGFVTSEIRDDTGTRVAFAVRDLTGPETVIAHVNSPSKVRVGKFGVDVDAFERVGLPALERAMAGADVIVIDEIANMELASPAFVALLPKIMHGGRPVVATMHLKAHPVTDEIRESGEIEVVEVTGANRDSLPHWILRRITQP